MRIDTNKRVLDIYLDTYPITAIYIGTELYYERQTGAIAYTLVGGDGTYYIVVGEASGDLHASNLMESPKKLDQNAQFRFFGGDLMKSAGGTLVKHYRDLAFMGIMPVVLNSPTILKNL